VFRRFSDPEEYVAALPLTSAKFQVAGIRDYNATVMTADMGAFRVAHGTATVGAAVHGMVGSPCVFILPTLPGPDRVVDGRTAPFGTIYHPASGDGYLNQATRDPSAWFGLSVDYEALSEVTVALSGRDLTPSSAAMFYTRVPDSALRRLTRLGTQLAHLAEHDPVRLRLPSVRTAFDSALGEALSACLAAAGREPDLAAARRHRRIMARLEAVGDAHPDEAVTLAQVCAMVGANARTLNLVSHNYMGMGPTQYLRARRLSRVRRALIEADPRIASVGDLAAAFGFWESGRFAEIYRDAFGEAPSDTLRRV
jgi:AraC-like DNA-binding protein